MIEFRDLQDVFETGASGHILVSGGKLRGYVKRLPKEGEYLVQLNRIDNGFPYHLGYISSPSAWFSIDLAEIPAGLLYELIIWNEGTDLRNYPHEPILI